MSAESIVDSDDTFARVHGAALRLLSVRERTRTESIRGLCRRGYPEEVVVEIIDSFVERGWVDDHRFALLFIRHQVRFRPRSHQLLRQELRKKGCSDTVARAALTELLEEDPDIFSEHVLALEACRKKIRTGGTERERVLRYLAGRGFSLDQAAQAWNEAATIEST